MTVSTILAIDTSTDYTCITLQRDTQHWQRRALANGKHNQKLFQLLDDFAEFWQYRDDIKTLVLGIGPGNYSSIRVGIAFAQSLQITLPEITIACLPIWYAIPLTWEQSKQNTTIIGNARNQLFYCLPIAEINPTMCQIPLLNASQWQQKVATIMASDTPTQWLTIEENPILPAHQLITHYQRADSYQLIQNWQLLSPTEQAETSQKLAQPFYLQAPNIGKSKRIFPFQALTN